MHAAEALECLGGNGYVEEWPLARLYREAPLNSIWEGSGNVQCLDVLRALQKTPESLAALTDEIGAARGGDDRLDAFTAALRDDLGCGARCRWRPRGRRAASSSGWLSPSKRRSSCAMRRARWRTPSAPAAWPARGGALSVPSLLASISLRSSIELDLQKYCFLESTLR